MASEKESLLPVTATDPPVRTRRSRLPLLGVFIVVVFWSVVHREVIAHNGLALWTRITESKHSLPIGIPNEIQHQWGQYSPYHRAGKYTPPPKGCEITQVNIVRSLISFYTVSPLLKHEIPASTPWYPVP